MFDAAVIPIPVAVVAGTGLVALVGARWLPSRNGWTVFCLVGLLAAAGFLIAGGTDSRAALVQAVLLGTALLFAFELLGGASESVPTKGTAFVPGLLSVALAGALIAVAARDLPAIFVGLETCTLALGLSSWAGSHTTRGREAALRYLAVGLVGTVLTLAGFALTSVSAGATDLDAIRRSFAVAAADAANGGERAVAASPLGVLGLVLAVGGLGVRAAVAPFHPGQARVRRDANAFAAGVVAVLPAIAALAVLLELALATRARLGAAGTIVCVVSTVVTITAGGAGALFRDNPRRVLAAIGTAHVGLALAALAVVFRDGVRADFSLEPDTDLLSGIDATLLFLVVHAVCTAGAHGVLDYLRRRDRGADFVDDLSGLGRTEPVAAVCLAVLVLGLTGLPPLPGFWLRFGVVAALVGVPDGPLEPYLLTALVVVSGSVLIAAVAARWLSVLFFDAPRSRVLPSGGEPALAASVLAAMLVVGVSLLPGPLLAWIRQARAPAASRDLGSGERSRANLVLGDHDSSEPIALRSPFTPPWELGTNDAPISETVVPLLRPGREEVELAERTACPAEAVPRANSGTDLGRASSGTTPEPN